MALGLIIDTALSTSMVAIVDEKKIIAIATQNEQTKVAQWLHVAIDSIFKKASLKIAAIDFVCVTDGPGSYTGLRIGMSTAKGICFSINKHLITVSNLFLYVDQVYEKNLADYYVPVIDAKRDEVYTAVYNKEKKLIEPLHSVILSENSFESFLKDGKVCVCGNAVEKTSKILEKHVFEKNEDQYSVETIQRISFEQFNNRTFANLIYTEPQYGKPFYFKN